MKNWYIELKISELLSDKLNEYEEKNGEFSAEELLEKLLEDYFF